MNMIFKSFAKQLFGADYARLTRTFFVCLIVFYGLHIAGWNVRISPVMLYLMTSTFTAGVMWQAFSCGCQTASMQNLFMLPFYNDTFVFSYVAALGMYTLFTKTGLLLTVLWAVSDWNLTEILGSILCVITAILITSVVYSLKQYRYISGIWMAAGIAMILFCGNTTFFIPLLILNAAVAALLLQRADGYTFYLSQNRISHTEKSYQHHSVGRYLFRYLNCHKNYLTNTAIMWCVAALLPQFLNQPGEKLFVVPIGFAILSLNTPLCILLSCDPDLEQAVRFLPGQQKLFCIPYCLFLFLCNMTANVIFLCSLQLQNHPVTVFLVIDALFFALQSAIFSVMLEWFCPVRNWKIESDLWHHPRKYVVPAIMLLLAGAVGTCPVLIRVLPVLLVFETAILLFVCWKQ